jgi:hypothetical protein
MCYVRLLDHIIFSAIVFFKNNLTLIEYSYSCLFFACFTKMNIVLVSSYYLFEECEAI